MKRLGSIGCGLARVAFLTAMLTMIFTGVSKAGAPGHYFPGFYNIRDYFVPDPGFYTAVYNVNYHAGQIHDAQGNSVTSLNINPGPGQGLKVNVNPSMDINTIAPVFMWAAPGKVLGAKYAAWIAPSFGNTSVSASLDAKLGPFSASGNPSASQFDAGDLAVSPLWLGWSPDHFDFSFNYTFYAPVGKYNVNSRNITVGPKTFTVTGAAPDNVGLGFWENQFQTAQAWYPWSDKRMAVAVAETYEINSQKKFLDLTPGNYFTFNWGISQMLPLNSSHELLAEVGPTGYLQWQTSHDSGANANFNALSSVMSAGFQTGLIYIPWNAFLKFLYYNEFEAKARQQGDVYNISIGKKW